MTNEPFFLLAPSFLSIAARSDGVSLASAAANSSTLAWLPLSASQSALPESESATINGEPGKS